MLEPDRGKFKIIGFEEANADVLAMPNMTFWQDAWRRLKQNKAALISMVVLIIIGVMCAIGPYISGHDFKFQDINHVDAGPSAEYWFGTDGLGRDMFSRLWIGGRVSMAVGLIGAAAEILIGCLYGGICGYFGGLLDDIMMRIVEIIVGIPHLIIVILISAALGKGVIPLIAALVITGWTGMARMIRGQVMQLKESEYVLAAQALGADPGRIIVKHLLPNTIGIIIVYISFDIPMYIFSEAFLSFIGLGIQPPNTSWGAMCSFGQQKFMFYPHELFFPATAICLTMLAFNLLGDGLRDALDPKLRQ